MPNNLQDIKMIVAGLAEKINAPPHLLPTYGKSIDGAHPHIEVNGDGQLYYVIVERGEELSREVTTDLNNLLYKVFADITFSMAVKHELNNRIDGEDSRRQLFAKQEELLGLLSTEWQQLAQNKHQSILRSNPFDDHAMIRADYAMQLRSNGMSAAGAWIEACKKYTLP